VGHSTRAGKAIQGHDTSLKLRVNIKNLDIDVIRGGFTIQRF